MLSAKGLKKTFGSKIILDNADIQLNKSVKAGLVGINGTGKSTLMNILAGEDVLYEGTLTYDQKIPLIGKMNQEIRLIENNFTILHFLKTYTGIQKVEEEINELLHKLEDPIALTSYGESYELFERMGGYEFESKANTIMAQLGIGKYDIHGTKISDMSGGEKNKLLLCATLLKGGDLLFLDEPTNNLDKKSIGGLIDFLKQSLASCLIVSHDISFLNDVTTKTFELGNGKIRQFGGNYDLYRQEKEEQYNQQLEAHKKQEEEYERAQISKRNLQEKAQSISNKGNSRDNDKGDGASKVAKKLARQAKVIASRVERVEKIEKPRVNKPLELILEASELPSGGISIEDLKFSYPSNSFSIFIESLTIGAGDKVLITGENGQGKSTFLKLLLGELKAGAGNIDVNGSINIGYYSQDRKDLPIEMSAIKYLESQGSFSEEDINYSLAKMGFEKEDREKAIELLSPGMKSKLIFTLLSLKHSNCIIFDEPTNHVDIETVKQLETAINNFKGIVVIVSHDGDFIGNININRSLEFVGGQCRELRI